MAYYSTQETIEARIKALRIKMWGDKDGDGVLDSATLTQALTAAKAEILVYIGQRYGTTVTDTWTETTRPDLIGMISDDITLYVLNTGSNVTHPIVVSNYNRAVAFLQRLEDYTISLPGVEFQAGQQYSTERKVFLPRDDSDIDTYYRDSDVLSAYQYP